MGETHLWIWNPLDFELPPLPEGTAWHRVLDTWLESPEDIHTLDDAPSLPENIYPAHPRSMVMLVSEGK